MKLTETELKELVAKMNERSYTVQDINNIQTYLLSVEGRN